MPHPYRVPAERPIFATRRVPWRAFAIAGAMSCAIVAGLLLFARTDVHQHAVAPVAPPPVITTLPDMPEVLYEGTWPGFDVRLLGIDTGKHRAAIELVNPKQRVYDTIDYEHHALVDQWEIQPSEYPPAWKGDFDLVRMAGFVRLGKGSMFPFGLDPMMAVDPAHGSIIYTRGDDHLFMVDPDGTRPRRLDDGLVASYDPMFSSDGAFVAMRACGRPCKYFLHLTDVEKRKPVRVDAVVDPRSYAWVGPHLFVLSRPSQGPAIFFRVDRHGSATEIFRADDMNDAELEVAKDGSVAVIGARGRFVFIDLETSTVFRVRPLDVGNLMSVGPHGVLFSTDRAGLVAYDPRTEKQATWPSEGFYLQPFYAHWEAPGTVIAARTQGQKMQLVRIRVGSRL